MGYRPLGADLSGRVALVTGANGGMGKETARELARMGAHVILGCRSPSRAEDARRDIVDSTGSPAVTVLPVDLSSLASVHAAAARSVTNSPASTCSSTMPQPRCEPAR